jgi:hypothetical protein
MARRRKSRSAAPPTPAAEPSGERPPARAARSKPKFPVFFPSESDDLSGHNHRQAIGYLGLVLCPLLWLISALRPTSGQPVWAPWVSVSAYYYSGAVAVFVGVLASLAVFFFTYWGYDNEHRLWDRIAAWVAGAAALGVAGFPSWPPAGVVAPSWWTPRTPYVHNASAAVLFGSFVFYCLVLFRRRRAGEKLAAGKRRRNRIYLACGIAIVLSMAWSVLARLAHRSLFWPETLALTSFAISWLTKGRAWWTLGRLRQAAGSVARTGKLPAHDTA